MALVTDFDGHTNRQARTRAPVVPSISRCGFVRHLLSVILVGLLFETSGRARENSVVPPKSVSQLLFRPFGAWSIPTGHPRLAPWAAFLRRFAALFSLAQR